MMSKQFRYGTAILSAALSFVTGTANASFDHCTSAKSGQQVRMLFRVMLHLLIHPFLERFAENSTVTATYTIQNNTPVTLKINYIRLQDNDSFPVGSATIVPAAVNPCGSSLAAGATCQISVKLTSTTTPGSFNRVLQVGIDSRQVQVSAPPITTTVDTALQPLRPFRLLALHPLFLERLSIFSAPLFLLTQQ